MKIFFLVSLTIFSQTSMAAWKFTCKNFELGEKDSVKIEVILESIKCTSSIGIPGFPCFRDEGWVSITANDFQDRFKVSYAQDYQRFYLYAYPDDESRNDRLGKNNYIIRSDDRLKTGSAPGVLEIKFPDSPFEKKLTYALTCQKN